METIEDSSIPFWTSDDERLQVNSVEDLIGVNCKKKISCSGETSMSPDQPQITLITLQLIFNLGCRLLDNRSWCPRREREGFVSVLFTQNAKLDQVEGSCRGFRVRVCANSPEPNLASFRCHVWNARYYSILKPFAPWLSLPESIAASSVPTLGYPVFPLVCSEHSTNQK